MSVMPSKFPVSKRKLLCFPVLAFAFCASSAWSQAAPPVVIDAQQTLGFGYSNPQSIAVSSNGTVFVADTNNNQIIALDTYAPEQGVNNIILTPGFTLATPQALALDANGNLFVGDTPSVGGTGVGRIIEFPGDGNGNVPGTNGKVIFQGTPLVNPVSLTVDSTGTLFIGDYPTATGVGVIYSLAPGGSPVALNITGIPTPPYTPAALLRSGTSLYFADNGNYNGSDGGIYVVPAIGGAATKVATGSFVINKPSGLALDAAGDLYILSFLGPDNPTYNVGEQVVIVPALSPTTPYILPNTGIGTSSSMAFDPNGNMDVLDSQDGAVIQLSSTKAVFMGNVFVGKTGLDVLFNFEFNAPANLRGFQVVTQGDVSSDLLVDTKNSNCAIGNHTNLGGKGGPAISPYFPYSCNESYYGNPAFPGNRISAIEAYGPGKTVLGSQAAYQTAFAGVEVIYPVDAKATAINLQQPQALAISGLNKKVYVADTEAGKVYSTPGLGSAALTPVSTGTITLVSPTALALDGAGNLFIADANNFNGTGAQIVEVPTTTGLAPSVLNTGGLLDNPIALAFDYLGNLYIGDAGPGGLNADSSNPGYIVKVPVGGTPFKMTIPPINGGSGPIIFPQALATDPYTAALLIGDGGNPGAKAGQVVQVSANGSSAGTGPLVGVPNPTNPTGLAFDQAEDLYILDGTANTITVVGGPTSGTNPWLLAFDNTTLSSASALAISAGGQSFVVANIGAGNSNSLVYLNGNSSTLAFGNVPVRTDSQPQTATVYNIGNLDLTLQSPYYSPSLAGFPFNVLGTSTCANNLVLRPSIPCTINVQFAPIANIHSTQQLKVNSDAYNTGIPALNLSGTGTLKGSEKHHDRRDVQQNDQRDKR
jgi:sugar lactone lactonase YvrE